jgi:hypothetical protein
MENLIKLSASRIKTLQSCSWTYYCNYNLKLPQKNNSGAIRGTIAHLIFELLDKQRHKGYIKKIIKADTCLKIKSIRRLICKLAKRENLDLDEIVKPIKKNGAEASNLTCIDQMILVGLKFDFTTSDKVLGAEVEFDISNTQPAYRISGFIDRIFEKDGALIVRDFKSSKMVFQGEDLESNVQAMMYTLATKKMYEQSAPRDILVKFLFLRYPDNPERGCPKFSEEEIKGFEYYLEYLNEYLKNFNEKKGKANFAANDFGKKWMCQTKSGWRCPYLNKIEYKVLLDENKKIIKSIFINESFKDGDIKENFSVENRVYEGCPAWKASKNDFDL